MPVRCRMTRERHRRFRLTRMAQRMQLPAMVWTSSPGLLPP